MNIVLALGANLGNKFNNLRQALDRLKSIMTIEKESIIFETDAVLPQKCPAEWNIPYLNMVVSGDTQLSPYELLNAVKRIENEMGREPDHEFWSPRIIDIDILYYGDLTISTPELTIPHKEIKNRPFVKSLLNFIGYEFFDDETNLYEPRRSFTLSPKLVGIVNVTPDSFSDGGKFLTPEFAVKRVNEILANGGYIAELGAQSTRPGYVEISPKEEIKRLAPVMEKIADMSNVGVDTYFDDVAIFALSCGVKWINDIRGNLADKTLQIMTKNQAKLVIMDNGQGIEYLQNRVKYLLKNGFCEQNIVIDPGIGFAKTRQENIEILKNISNFPFPMCQTMVGHSRKSFIKSFASSANRDMETLAISSYLADKKVGYLRVHDVENHMKLISTKTIFSK